MDGKGNLERTWKVREFENKWLWQLVSRKFMYPVQEWKGCTLKCLSIGTPKNNKFSICPKWKIYYFQVSQNLGRVQPHYNVLEYWDP